MILNNTPQNLAQTLIQKKLKFACAESCTGGMVAMVCTDLAGSSLWFDRGFVTYSNESKLEMLGVDQSSIEQYGAVSQPVAEQMVSGVIKNSHADVAVSLTGIAGPSGGSQEKPVGTVWIAWSVNGKVSSDSFLFKGSRQQVREQATEIALLSLNEILKEI